MNERKNNGRGIFYGVIGVATLVVAIIGATFAYFTASAANNTITGNMATVKLALDVEKVSNADDGIGMIPMSNSMVDAAVRNASEKGICIDNNGNPVCQVYKITLINDSSAGQFVDGYVALRGGSGEPTDYNQYPEKKANDETQAVWPIDGLTGGNAKLVGTTMRWAQAFCTEYTEADETKGIEVGDLKTCSTAGIQYLGSGSNENVNLASIDNKNVQGQTFDGKNDSNIRWENELMETTVEGQPQTNARAVLKSLPIAGTSYKVIGTNYIRVSNHQWTADGGAGSYKRETDVTSALVFNHNIPAKADGSDANKGVYYIVVWLSETGTNQTAGLKEGDTAIRPGTDGFFVGNVTFISAQGSEVSATFANHTRVPAQG